MSSRQSIDTCPKGISEGSLYERLRRHPGVDFDPFIAHGSLIYHPPSASLLRQIHQEYIGIAIDSGLPIFLLTDTWRANPDRIARSRFLGRPVNQDNVHFLAALRQETPANGIPIFIGGSLGPRGDAYKPGEALGTSEARQFHSTQVKALAAGGVDFLYASTLPALSEAQGIAAAMADTGLPYILSFVVRRNGALLDGTHLGDAIRTIDDLRPSAPIGYAVNCVHPTIFLEAMTQLQLRDPRLVRRIVSFKANTSARDPEQLDGAAQLETADPEALAPLLAEAHHRFGIKFLGGCCGTDASHIRAVARAMTGD
jgi:homocysteine S-methyltransferase